MDRAALADAAAALAPGLDAYVRQGLDARRRVEKRMQQLLAERKLPKAGWADAHIELLLHEMAMLDSNTFLGNAGVGEREARIASALVARRHFGLGHGVGRSGDIGAIQPKAAGSSVLARLAEGLVLDLLRQCGAPLTKSCLILPLATGMGILMTLLALRQRRPQARKVIWPRIDQKTCLKAIVSAGFEPVVVENVLEGDELRTDLAAIEALMAADPEAVLAVITTTSCFAPRVPDRWVWANRVALSNARLICLEEVAKLCAKHSVPHIVNNAYGLQLSKCMHLVNQAMRAGRVDAYVQSTDKNLMVPVGGCIVASSDKNFIQLVSKTYPGRASASPMLDVLITLLSLGLDGYKTLLAQRKELYLYCRGELAALAAKHGERLLETKNNPISLAMSLGAQPTAAGRGISYLGSMLFSRFVSGTRVLDPAATKTVAGFDFKGYGSHCDNYPTPYLTAAVAIGMEKHEIDTFIKRLDATLSEHRKQVADIAAAAPPPEDQAQQVPASTQ